MIATSFHIAVDEYRARFFYYTFATIDMLTRGEKNWRRWRCCILVNKFDVAVATKTAVAASFLNALAWILVNDFPSVVFHSWPISRKKFLFKICFIWLSNWLWRCWWKCWRRWFWPRRIFAAVVLSADAALLVDRFQGNPIIIALFLFPKFFNIFKHF